MSRLNRILLATVLLLCSILWLQHRRTIRLTEERDRFRMNSTALLSDVKRMQIDSATMVLDAKALRLTIDEYKEFRAKDAETIERLGVKIRKNGLVRNRLMRMTINDCVNSVCVRDHRIG